MPDLEGSSESDHRKKVEEGEGSLREQLEAVTRERDSFKNNHERLEAVWRRRIQHLEKELDEANERDATTGHVLEVSRQCRGYAKGE